MRNQQLVEAVMKRIYYLLNEGRNADKSKQKTLEVIRKFFNNASWLDNEFEDAAANPNHLSVIDYIEHKLKELCFHANIPDSVIRLEPIIMNIALSLGFEQQNQDTTKLNRLFRIVAYITRCITEKLPLPEPLKQLNELTLENTTYDRLNDLFGKVLDKQDAAESERINNADYSEGMNTNYEILSDIDYETANHYGDYSCSDSKLCYTQSESTWNQYTNSGNNTVYLLLRKDWQNIPEEHGENTPYDDYGLSMIFVFVDEEGNIAYSNTRWNHNTNGQGPRNVDQSFTKEYLSQLLNVNFGSVFKPLHSFAEKVAEVKQQLQNGADPKDVFDNVRDFSEGFAVVELGDKYNFINTDGNILRDDLWFDDVSKFSEGFAMVELNYGWNFINTDGRLLRDDLWFDDAWGFSKGFAVVELGDKWNFIDTDGNILRDDLWFDNVRDFSEGFAMVELNDKWNLINTDGNILRDDLWFDNASGFSKGFAMVELGDKWNFINTDGNILRDDLWFDRVWEFYEGFARVELNDKYNFINTDGNLLRDDMWFDWVRDFKDGFAWVELNGKYNFIDTDGNILSDDLWFDEISDFSEGFARVELNYGWNFINTDGRLLRDDLWFDWVRNFKDSFAKVELNGKWYYIDTKGNLYDKNKNPINNVAENRCRVVHLTESKLRNTIKSVITQYLNESRNYK